VNHLQIGYSLATLAPGYVGGSESYARGLLGPLAASAELRVRVIANSTVAASSAWTEENAELARLPGHFDQGLLTRATAMSRMLLDTRRAGQVSRGLDVMHYPMTVPLPRVDGLPTVLTLQDMQHREHPGWFSRPELLFRRAAYDRAAQHAGRVVTATEHARDQIVEHLAIDRNRIDVIAHGIDHSRFSPSPTAADARRLATLPLPERFLLYPANMWPHKNHERLVQAIAGAADRQIGLVLTGQDYGRLDALLAHARQLGVGGRVTHLGHVDADVIPALYRRATGMIFPSLFEGFGIPVIEAMASGCPVAASNRSALPEVVDGAGGLFDPTDIDAIAAAIDDLTAEGEPRDARIRAGLARASLFSWERCADAHIRVYQRAAGDRP